MKQGGMKPCWEEKEYSVDESTERGVSLVATVLGGDELS